MLLPRPYNISPDYKRNYVPVRELFVHMDDFQRAIEAARLEKDFAAIIRGLELIYHNFELLLQKHDIFPFAEPGDIFDPECHEIVEGTDVPPDQGPIIDLVIRVGFRQGSSVIRKALVSVRAPSQ